MGHGPAAQPTRPALLAAAFTSLQGGDFSAVARLVEPLHAADPAAPEEQLLLGLALGALGEDARAIALLQRVARQNPHAQHPAQDLIALLTARRATARIADFLHAATSAARQDVRLLTLAAEWFRRTGDEAASVPLLQRALAQQPGDRAARICRAALMADQGALEQASLLLRELIAEDGESADALGNLGIMLGHQARFDEADEAFRRAREHDPQQIRLAISHGIALLKAGRLEAGWTQFNRRLALPGHALLPPHRLLPRLAEGVRLDGRTVLVTHDSGFGDTLQFVRYVPLLQARGARVLLWVPPELHRLLHGFAGADVFSQRGAWPLHDWHCPVIRLAEVVGTTLATIPGRVPYLQADPALVAAWAARLPTPSAEGLRIGLVWAGSQRETMPELQPIDRRRSIAPQKLAPLMMLPGIQWISLQKDRPSSGLTLHDPMGDARDFADTAAIIAHLDAVVSVDTAVAHLAGALGKPVLLLDRYDNCWRWLSGRDDSPWYPNLRIFRQTHWGDWSAPVQALGTFLAG